MLPLGLPLLLCCALASPAGPPAEARDEIPITTSSVAAREAFLRGREAVEGQLWPQARAALGEAVRLDPQFVLAEAYLGRATTGDAGAVLLARAVARAKDLPQGEKMLIEEMEAERAGDEQRSRNLTLQLARLFPRDWRAQFRAGLREVAEGHFPQAVEQLQRAASLAPTEAEPHNLLGYVLARGGRLSEAIEEERLYVKLAPGRPNPSDSLGEILLMAGRFEEAEAAFLRATAVDPHFTVAWMGVAQARFFRGDWRGGQLALESGRAAAIGEANQAQFDVYLAWSWLCRHEGAKALRELGAVEDRARRTNDRVLRAMAISERARLLFEFGRHRAALQEARRALLAAVDSFGQPRADVELRARLVIAQVGGRAHNPSTVQEALGPLLDDVHRAPLSARLRSAATFAQAELALARGDPKRAAQELQACGLTDWLCQGERVEVEELAGNASAAAREAQRILGANFRDPIYNREDPTYLWVRTKLLARQATPKAFTAP